jgi:hypothetical protein
MSETRKLAAILVADVVGYCGSPLEGFRRSATFSLIALRTREERRCSRTGFLPACITLRSFL